MPKAKSGAARDRAGNSIYDTLVAHLSGSTLTLTSDTFPGDIADVLTEYFPPDGTLVINDVQLAQDGDAVTFADATGATAPLTQTTISARFEPAAGELGETGVVMRLTAVPKNGWKFSTGWPLLAGGPTDQLSVTKATLTLSSASVPSGPAKGLSFAGTIGFPPAWQVLLWLLGEATSVLVSSPITQKCQAPSFAFTAPIGSVDLPVLGSVKVSFTCDSVIVSGAAQPPQTYVLASLETAETPPALPSGFGKRGKGGKGGKKKQAKADDGPIYSPWVPQVTLGVTATIQIAGTPVPILVDLSNPSSTLTITTDVSKLSLVALTDLVNVLDGADLSTHLPPKDAFDPGQFFTLDTLSFTLNPAKRTLVSAGITLGTHKAWPITDGLSAGPVTFTFLVGFAPKMIAASLTGSINFSTGSFGLGAYYPGFQFTGGLTPGSSIDLSALISKVLDNTPIGPTLILSELDFVVQPLNGGSFSLATALTGDWSFNVGVAKLELTRAYLDLNRQSNGSSGAGTSGAIGLTGKLTPPQKAGQPITFDGSWNLPGSFSLNAKFPDLNLTALAAAISEIDMPAGIPEVELTDGVVAIVLNLSTGEYSFALATGAKIDGTELGSALFALRKTATEFGFLIGFVVTETWSPAQVWPEFADIFGKLEFTDSGLLISTLPAGSPVNLPNLKMPSLPATVSSGFTFFSTLALGGDILGPLTVLFDGGATLNLLAIVDTTTPANSAFQAIFKGTSINNNITWNDIVITLKPAATTFSIKAGATFTIEGEKLTLSGEGTVQLEPPAVSFALLVENWRQPFGITNLVIKTFGLKVGIEEAGVTIGLLGAFQIGTEPRTFTLVVGGELIDFEAPGAIIFKLDSDDPSNPLMLSDVIKQFTQLDPTSVPVLNAIGFTKLEFAVVDDPAGFTIGDYTFPPGIGIAADIFIYSWEAKFGLQVTWGKGIIASGSISKPISLAGVLTISNADGTAGPSGSIDTSQIPSRTQRRALEQRREQVAIGAGAQPYITLDGRLQFLGIDESIKASASGKSFEFEVSFAFLDVVRAHLACSLADAKTFAASAAIGFDLDVTLGPYSVGGIELIPQVHIDGPSAALAFGIAINPTVIFEMSLDLKFTWGTLGFDIGFTLTAADIAHELTNLWNALITWLKDNVGKLFADLLADVAKWVKALEDMFKEFAEDIEKVANALANFFKTAAEDAAAFLKRLGFEFLKIVDALVEFFRLAFDEAYEIVESLWDDCAMQNAQEQAYDPTAPDRRFTVPDAAYELTASRGGQQLLATYFRHQDELDVLLAPHPYLADRLAGLGRSHQRSSDMRLLCDTAVRALVAVAPKASAGLSEDIDELIPLLMRYRDLSMADVLTELESGG